MLVDLLQFIPNNLCGRFCRFRFPFKATIEGNNYVVIRASTNRNLYSYLCVIFYEELRLFVRDEIKQRSISRLNWRV